MATRASARVPAAPAVTFGVLSDSNRWDRLLGMPPTRYTYRRLVEGDPASRVRVGAYRRLGVPIRFVELGEYWAPARFRGERRYLPAYALFVRRAFVEVEVVPDDGGSRVDVRVGAEVRWLGWLVAAVVLLRARLAARRYLREVARVLARDAVVDRAAPAAAQARLALLAAGDPGRALGGPRARARDLDARAARLDAAPVDGAARDRLLAFVREAPDDDLVQVRPFEVATAWGLDRREVVRAFLHATRAGLFDLEWQIDCPTCRVGASWAPTLDALGRRVHCDECDVAFDVDFADNVEATFTVNPAVRPVARHVWCAGSPAWRPHVHAHVVVKAGETRAFASLPPGPLLLRVRGAGRQLRVDERRGALAVRVTADAVVEVAPPAGAAPDALIVENASAATVGVQVERAGWSADRLRGRLLVALPDYLALFGTEAPAAGLQLSVGTVAVLFTDLVGSTELYEQLGDARAFALVQRHWRACETIAARHGGSVLKTLGDGLMCCFTDVAGATAAALAMMEAADAIAHAEPDAARFAIRAAVHEGPCYLVRANERLDLFGATVNLASRLLGHASASQLAMLTEALDRPSVAERLADAASVATVETPLRGLRGVHAIAVATRRAADVFETGRHPPLASGTWAVPPDATAHVQPVRPPRRPTG